MFTFGIQDISGVLTLDSLVVILAVLFFILPTGLLNSRTFKVIAGVQASNGVTTGK
jgi:hypothetical protein